MLNDTAVSEIMTHYLITVTPTTTLDKVNEIFEQHDFHHLLVVEGTHLEGIISRSDVDRVSSCVDLFHTKANELYNKKLFKSLLAKEVMTPKAVVLAPDDSIGYAATLFARNTFHALPVVVGEKLVGMLTTFDLIDYMFNGKLKPVPLTE
jgi:CBS domain-containing protein